MRERVTPSSFHPALLLALSVAFCGFSLAEAPAMGHARQVERVVEATSGRDAVALLLSCLEDAAKELRKHDGKQAALPAPRALTAAEPRPSACERSPIEVDLPPPGAGVCLHHLDMPPPTRA